MQRHFRTCPDPDQCCGAARHSRQLTAPDCALRVLWLAKPDPKGLSAGSCRVSRRLVSLLLPFREPVWRNQPSRIGDKAQLNRKFTPARTVSMVRWPSLTANTPTPAPPPGPIGVAKPKV